MPSLPLYVNVDPALPEPLHAQVYRALRQAIDDGRIGPRELLPSTRKLANDLRIGRNTVLRAMERLKAEGLVEGRTGSGLRVSRRPAVQLSALPAQVAHAPSLGHMPSAPFLVGTPPLDIFPGGVWARVAARRWRAAARDLIEYGDSLGYLPLRNAVADYLRTIRGVSCSSEQILITSGAQHAFDIAIRAVAEPGDAVMIEDPGRPEVRQSLLALGMRPIAAPVDREGFSPVVASRLGHFRVAAVTPGCHFPTGVSLSLRRRTQLIELVKRSDTWIVEDDQYSVTRFAGRPLPTLHSMDAAGRTVLIGSFEHELFPGIRVGYAVLPHAILDRVLAGRTTADQHVPTSTQATLADFMAEGHFVRHLHRLRNVIGERYEAFARALSKHCGDILDPWPPSAGVHAVAWLPTTIAEPAVIDAAARWEIEVRGVTSYSTEAARPGLVLCFGGWSVEEIEQATVVLAKALAMSRSANRGPDNDGINSFADAFKMRP